MSLKKLVLVVVAFLLIAALVVTAVSSWGAETAPAKETAKPAETAIFAVPNLSDAAFVKSLTGALAREAGVISAKADAGAGKFLVTFEPAKTNPEALTKALVKVSPEARFEKVQPSDAKAPEKDACGKCPSRATCGGKK